MNRSRPSSESGYVLATTALLLIPLMVFAAFAVDVGGWYAEADEAQRAADAAALAGVVWMPDFARATDEARAVALANGFDNADPDVTVATERRGTQGFYVNISTLGESHFGKVVSVDNIPIDRFAASEYVMPVPLGNPGSGMGTGQDTPPIAGDPSERLLLALNGFCSGASNGDPLSAELLGGWDTSPSNATTCNSSGTPNPKYVQEGYYFVADFTGPMDPVTKTRTPVTGQWRLQIWEPGACGEAFETSGRVPRLQTTMYKGDTTLITDDDNITDSNRSNNAISGLPDPYLWDLATCGGGNGGWVTAYNIDADLNQGRWLLNVRTRPNTGETYINNFGLRIVPAGNQNMCGDRAGQSVCPTLSARTWLPIFIPSAINGVNSFGGGQSAYFYLANVDEIHARKTLEIKLFDPGEGMDNMQLLSPDGTRYPFTFAVNSDAPGDFGSADVCSDVIEGSVTITAPPCLDVTSGYNGDLVSIRVPIPDNYSCVDEDPGPAVSKSCWWRIRYQPQSSGSISDRTSWQVRVIGDPVRLVE